MVRVRPQAIGHEALRMLFKLLQLGVTLVAARLDLEDLGAGSGTLIASGFRLGCPMFMGSSAPRQAPQEVGDELPFPSRGFCSLQSRSHSCHLQSHICLCFHRRQQPSHLHFILPIHVRVNFVQV
ncbi:hypothetical protein C8F01DRAFT_1165611 [Mycena amicta]|nr:hypothetical protein C8F01DRAFT_1165611 [Mycena amicta]